jgi:hypothetical protein
MKHCVVCDNEFTTLGIRCEMCRKNFTKVKYIREFESATQSPETLGKYMQRDPKRFQRMA